MTETTPSLVVPQTFRVSPLIRFALWSLYLTLILPLPILSQVNDSVTITSLQFGLAFLIGGLLLQAALSERVQLDQSGIALTYPFWIPAFFRQGWALPWHNIQRLQARSTGQGGLVYYLVNDQGKGFLLPTRIAGFHRMVQRIQQETGIDTSGVKPLAQPWMYGLVLIAAVLMALFDGWVFWMAQSLA